MTDRGNSPLVRSLALLTLAGAGVATALGVFAHMDATADLNPLSWTISDYAVSDRGGAMDTAMLVLGLSSLALPVALWLRGCARRALAVLLMVWALGLVASAVVPTDPPGAPEMTFSGYTRRYVSVAAFVSLPFAGVLLLRAVPGMGRRVVRWLSAASGAGLLVLLYVAFPGERVMMGLVERALVLTELALLAAMALPLARRLDPAARRLPAVPEMLPDPAPGDGWERPRERELTMAC
ncbi:DUF998 domain-containing protein [Rhizomonospora bruguierae]|uniref:DUF998 domain-containing protein n=1 Tax=Rhizomonospora bruguierae TaxID=1581705 RepID=UPI001BCE99B4|nr:DUF998 domain-containing protein [Micromonospora sp. NBRC 107566]